MASIAQKAPTTTHNIIIAVASGTPAATTPGERNMPCPIVPPTTAAMPNATPSTRSRWLRSLM